MDKIFSFYPCFLLNLWDLLLLALPCAPASDQISEKAANDISGKIQK